jgi:DNA-binding beta-propeller fold protein YncE
MSSWRVWRAVACGMLSMALAVEAFGWGTGYYVRKRFRIPSSGGFWAHSTIDEASRRLFVAHGTQVDVVNVDTGELVGTIPDTKGARAIALAREFKRGFITNGDRAAVTMFDLDTLKRLSDIPAGDSPDFIAYDPSTKRVFTFNAAGRSSTVIKAADGTVAGSIDLDGKTGVAVADGAGHVLVNLRDKGIVARIDSQKLAVDQRWPVADCEQPSGLALDQKNHRLFIGCNLMLYVMDSDNGRIITHLSVGENPDSIAFDPATGLIFTSSDDGLITVIHQDGPDAYSIADTLYTKAGSKTLALDLKTHRVFVPVGEIVTQAPRAPGGKATKEVLPNTFAILVVAK